MTDVVYIRDDFPPFARRRRLTKVSNLDRAYGLMMGNPCVFSLSPNDDAIADVQRGRVVEILRPEQVTYVLQDNQAKATGSALFSYFGGFAYERAQSFLTPPVGYGLLSSVQLAIAIATGAPTGNLGVEIRNDNGSGKPGTVKATSATLLDVTTLTTSESWQEFAFSPAVTLDANTVYHIAWKTSGLTLNDEDNNIKWYYNPAYHLSGNPSYSPNGGTTWYSATAYDFKLKFGYSHVGGYRRDVLAPWIGYVERLSYEHQSGAVIVECVDVATKIGERLSGLTASRSGAAGLIARDLLYQANARNPFGLQWDTSSEAGSPISDIDVSGSSLLDALNKLAAYTGDEWWIICDVGADHLEMKLHWGSRKGFDYSQSLYLKEGQEISSYSYGQDTLEQAESVMVLGTGGTSEERPAVMRASANPERIAESGVIVQPASESYRRNTPLPPALAAERIVISPRQSDVELLAQLAENELETPLDAMETFRVTVNERADWSKLDVGNIVRVKLGSVPWGNVDRRVRILEMQPGDGEMMLEVKALADE